MAWGSNKITSWSFSRLGTYEQCPFKLKCSAILRIKEPEAAPDSPMGRGNIIHKKAEEYVKGAGRAVPKELAKFKDEIKGLRDIYKKQGNQDPNRPFHERGIIVEETIALRSNWTLTTWNDWNGCWLRIKTDVSTLIDGEAQITDYKTGKYSNYNLAQYEDQLDLYKLGGLVAYAPVGPSLKVTARLLYLDHGVTHPPVEAVDVARPKDLPGLKKKWEKRVKAMLNDTTFAPKPNKFCYSCHYRKSNGGPCKFD